MLKAAVVEAISLADKSVLPAAPKPADVQVFLAEAEKGTEKERATVAKSKVVTRQTENEVVYKPATRPARSSTATT